MRKEFQLEEALRYQCNYYCMVFDDFDDWLETGKQIFGTSKTENWNFGCRCNNGDFNIHQVINMIKYPFTHKLYCPYKKFSRRFPDYIEGHGIPCFGFKRH